MAKKNEQKLDLLPIEVLEQAVRMSSAACTSDSPEND